LAGGVALLVGGDRVGGGLLEEGFGVWLFVDKGGSAGEVVRSCKWRAG